MSPTAAGMAAALHVLTALALWWATPYKSYEVPEQPPIEVTMEEPQAAKAETPPAKAETPPQPPQSAVKPPGALTQPPPPPTPPTPEKPAQTAKPNVPLGVRPPTAEPQQQQATAQPEPKKQEPAPEPKKEEAAPKPEPPAETKLPSIAEPPAPLSMQDFVRAAPPPPPMEIIRPQPRVQATPPPAAPHPPTVQQQPAPQFAPSPLSHLAPQQQQKAPAEAHAAMVNPADTAARSRIVDEYLWQVGRKMSEHRTYSLSASEQGSVILRLTIARDGRLMDASVARSSGSNNLDAASVALARSASPYAPLPPELTGNQVTFILPLNYKKFD
jgi:TonB family protein